MIHHGQQTNNHPNVTNENPTNSNKLGRPAKMENGDIASTVETLGLLIVTLREMYLRWMDTLCSKCWCSQQIVAAVDLDATNNGIKKWCVLQQAIPQETMNTWCIRYTEMMGHQHGMDGVSKTDHPILGYFGHPKFGTSLNLTKPWISWTDIFRESGRKWNAKDMWLPSLFLERQCAFRSREFSPLRETSDQWSRHQWCWCSNAGPTWGCGPQTRLGRTSSQRCKSRMMAGLAAWLEKCGLDICLNHWSSLTSLRQLMTSVCVEFSVNISDVKFCKATPSLTWTMRCNGLLWLSVVICG